MTDAALDFAAALRRFGTANPEKVDNPLWLEALRENWSAWSLRQRFTDRPVGLKGAFWSWQRYGRSKTVLPDGRIVHIAGEHEDHYDPDFCIYNDVVVEHTDGRFDFYLYPREVFPPTDFHTATLMGDWIYLIGSLGYAGARGDTIQVMRLDSRDLHIERVETEGEVPGWLSKHRAERLDDTRIQIVGGKFFSDDESSPNNEIFELDIASRRWRIRAHGDVSIFPVSREVYDACKSPQIGCINPEKVDNPFWLEMARRRWLPSRARLHFGDPGPQEPKWDLPPADSVPDLPAFTGDPRADAEIIANSDFAKAIMASLAQREPTPVRTKVVWTAVRSGAATIDLGDRKLHIGGEIDSCEDGFTEEWADTWVYADVMVEHPEGRFDFYVYPPEVFPPLAPLCALANGEDVLIFGRTESGAPEGEGALRVLRLDTSSFEVERVESGQGWPVNFYCGCRVVDGVARFKVEQFTSTDPLRSALFDLDTLRWRDEVIEDDGWADP